MKATKVILKLATGLVALLIASAVGLNLYFSHLRNEATREADAALAEVFASLNAGRQGELVRRHPLDDRDLAELRSVGNGTARFSSYRVVGRVSALWHLPFMVWVVARQGSMEYLFEFEFLHSTVSWIRYTREPPVFLHLLHHQGRLAAPGSGVIAPDRVTPEQVNDMTPRLVAYAISKEVGMPDMPKLPVSVNVYKAVKGVTAPAIKRSLRLIVPPNRIAEHAEAWKSQAIFVTIMSLHSAPATAGATIVEMSVLWGPRAGYMVVISIARSGASFRVKSRNVTAKA